MIVLQLRFINELLFHNPYNCSCLVWSKWLLTTLWVSEWISREVYGYKSHMTGYPRKFQKFKDFLKFIYLFFLSFFFFWWDLSINYCIKWTGLQHLNICMLWLKSGKLLTLILASWLLPLFHPTKIFFSFNWWYFKYLLQIFAFHQSTELTTPIVIVNLGPSPTAIKTLYWIRKELK